MNEQISLLFLWCSLKLLLEVRGLIILQLRIEITPCEITMFTRALSAPADITLTIYLTFPKNFQPMLYGHAMPLVEFLLIDLYIFDKSD